MSEELAAETMIKTGGESSGLNIVYVAMLTEASILK
jgi:hypothetical protein